MKNHMLSLAFTLIALAMPGCSSPPSERDLRDSFAAQLAANPSVKDFARRGDDLSFSGPGVGGRETARWRVHIDSALLAPTNHVRSPYKGTVKSSWYADDQPVRPGGRASNLPAALSSTGLAQDCWANWDAETRRWEWE